MQLLGPSRGCLLYFEKARGIKVKIKKDLHYTVVSEVKLRCEDFFVFNKFVATILAFNSLN